MKFLCIIVLLSFINFAKANCSNLIRLELNKRMNVDLEYLSGIQADQFYINQKNFLDNVFTISSVDDILKKKRTKKFKLLLNYLRENRAPEYFKKLIIFTIRTLVNSNIIKEWAENLYRDIVIEMHLKKGSRWSEHFFSTEEIHKEIALTVLSDRSKEGGFSGDYKLVRDELISKDFAKVLRSKKLIYDKEFESSPHGSLVHILQFDLLIYALKKQNINPQNLSSFYSWLGQSEYLLLNNGQKFSLVKHAWGSLFDSEEFDISTPEVLNYILQNYYNWIFID